MDNKSFINNEKIHRMAQNALIIAIMLIMAFTPLGYIKTPTVEITLMPIPVVVGAIVLGPVSGLLFGAVFGITSFLQCIGFPTLSWFGSMLLEINGIHTFLMCMIPRMLMGLLAGLLFVALNKIDKTKLVSYIVTCVSGAVMNTVFFLIFLMFLFGTSSFILDMKGSTSLIMFMVTLVGINGLIEAGVCAFVGVAVSKVLGVVIDKRSANKKRF
jgi:Predicted membrane protein